MAQSTQEIVVSVLGELLDAGNNPEFYAIMREKDFTFQDLEVDSLTVVEFCLELEKRFDVEIDQADVVSFPSVIDFAQELDRRRRGHIAQPTCQTPIDGTKENDF